MAGSRRTDPEKQVVEAVLLLDTYGPLLTDRQRQFMRLHFENDLSFSEVAREFDISRQAVHDSVRHALRTLEGFEDALGLVAARREPGQAHIGGRQLVERLCGLRDRVIESSENGTVAWIATELDDLIGLLEGRPSPTPTHDKNSTHV